MISRALLQYALVMLCATGTLAAQTLPPVENIGGVSLPGVPVSVATAAVEAGNAARSAAEGSAPTESVTEPATPTTLTVAPGTTELVRIARGYLNHVKTPFADPKLLTANPLEVRKEGASLFLTTTSEKPVGVHILSNDPDDTRSISLTLIPARIPPRTIELRWQDGAAGSRVPGSPARAHRWEQSSPYVEKLLELAELTARGEIPEGYSFAENDTATPCHSPSLSIEPGQRLTGARFSVLVMKATNTGDAPFEIQSNGGCHAPGVALVAAWPHAQLAPKASTELIIVLINDVSDPQERGHHRPTLMEGGQL